MHICMIDPDWDHYRAFLATLQSGSFSEAARRLGRTQPTLGRQIGELERRLGAPLFVRSPQGLLPTDAAEDLRPHAEAMAACADALLRAASGGSAGLSGVVRITASEVVGAEVLPPILADLRQAQGGIDIELSLSNAAEDLLHRAADIAVRMVRPTQAALVARRIGEVGLGLYAHRRYLDGRPAPARLEDLNGHALIGFDRETPFLRQLLARLQLDRSRFALRSDNDLAQIAAIRAGVGVGVMQHPLARRDPDLVPVCPDGVGFTLEMWLVQHEDLRASRRIRATFDALAVGLEAYLKS